MTKAVRTLANNDVSCWHSPSNRPEKLSVALHLFFFLFLFLASGMSIGWLDGMSSYQDERKEKTVKQNKRKKQIFELADVRHKLNHKVTGLWLYCKQPNWERVPHHKNTSTKWQHVHVVWFLKQIFIRTPKIRSYTLQGLYVNDLCKSAKASYSPGRVEQSKLKAGSRKRDPVLENSSVSKGFWPWNEQMLYFKLQTKERHTNGRVHFS